MRDDGIAFKPTTTAHSSGARVLVPITMQIREVLGRARRRAVHDERDPQRMEARMRARWSEERNDQGSARAKALTDAMRAGYDNEELQVAAAHSSVATTEGYLRQYAEPLSRIELTLPMRRK
ncbi:MAG: hypothetical protein HY017_10505 [Betaproteobacteria bacterium]|nr:hypothetical protein [Betaproteobacteria bacterium]